MDFKYYVKVTAEKGAETFATSSEILAVSKCYFGHDPFILRQHAFSYAASIHQRITLAENDELSEIFNDRNSMYRHFEVSVNFIDPKTEYFHEIHSFQHLRETELLNGTMEYEPTKLKDIINELNQEFSILTSNGIPEQKKLDLELIFTPSREKISASIFPTPYVFWSKRVIPSEAY